MIEAVIVAACLIAHMLNNVFLALFAMVLLEIVGALFFVLAFILVLIPEETMEGNKYAGDGTTGTDPSHQDAGLQEEEGFYLRLRTPADQEDSPATSQA